MRSNEQKLFQLDNSIVMTLEKESIVQQAEDNPAITIDSHLKDYIEKYVKSFMSNKQEIEIKGRLIDFIRKIK